MSKPHTGPARPADKLHLLPRHREMLLDLLREHLLGIEVWAYGSRVNGQSHDGSDLDLVLRSPDLQEIPIGQLADFWEALRESNIPFLVEARDWARLPEGFHREIERGYVVLTHSTPSREPPANWLYHPLFPDHWDRMSLYSMAQWINGLAYRNIEFSATGRPIIKITEIKGGISDQTKFTHQTFDESVRVRAGDLLFSWSGQPETSIDASWWRGPEGWLNQHIFRVTPSAGIDTGFFFYLLRYLNPNFVAIARNKQTIGLGHVTKQDLENIEAALPNPQEQRAIAYILGTLDDKIELNRRMNETLESMSRALFKSWFVDFDPVHAKAALKRHAANQIPRRGNSTRATKVTPSDHSPLEGESARQGRQPAGEPVGRNQTPLALIKGGDWTAERAQEYLDGMESELVALFPDSFAASELGPVPAGWVVRPLAECVDVTRGLSYQGSKLADTGLPMHNLNSIYEGGGYKQAGIKYYAGDFKARHTTHPGDLLVANTEQGHDRLLIGYAAIVPSRSGATSLFSHHIYRLRSPANLTPDYLCHLLNTQRMHDRVSGYATGTTVNMLPLDALRLPRVVVPCGPLVTAFDRAAKATRERQEQIIEEVHTLTALRDALLPKLVSGELRIEAPQGFLTEFHDG